MGQLNDISLVAQVVVFKNTRAFDTLVKKYQSPVRRFFLHQTLGDGELSDDLAQETFLKAYTNLSSFKNLSSFSTWLYRIAYNVFYDYIRGKKETSGLEEREIDASCQVEQTKVGEQMDIYRGLSRLKEAWHSVFLDTAPYSAGLRNPDFHARKLPYPLLRLRQ